MAKFKQCAMGPRRSSRRRREAVTFTTLCVLDVGDATWHAILMRSLAVILLLATAGPSWPSQAQTVEPQARSAALDRLLACRVMTTAADRLACFDAAAAALDGAARSGEVVVVDRGQIDATRRQLFGFDLRMPILLQRGEADLEGVETTLVRTTGEGSARVMHLADGSRWRQVDIRAGQVTGRAGDAVRIRRAALGSYLMTVGGHRGLRVRRIVE